NAGAGLAVSIPGQTLSVAFIAKGYAHGRVSSSIDQNDIQYLRDIQHDERVALREAGRAALLGSDEITKHLNSTASGRVAIVSDYGIALAKQFVVGEVPVSIGVTPYRIGVMGGSLALRQNCKKPGSITTPPQFITTTVATGIAAAIAMTIRVLTLMRGLLPISVKTGRWG
ncbi:Putative exported protein, partial [Salmonella enterica subsp. enterica serovar Inverness str. R8-3668]